MVCNEPQDSMNIEKMLEGFKTLTVESPRANEDGID